jgi:hypothetical protein
MTPEDRATYGFGRVRNAAYEAVLELWRRRKAEGLTQLELGSRIGMDPARVCKHLSGPGNWTLRTFGELVEGLEGEAEISVHALEDPLSCPPNFHAYAGYGDELDFERAAAPELSIQAKISKRLQIGVILADEEDVVTQEELETL